MEEWLAKDDNLFVGASLSFPKFVSEDSKYFIPPDDTSLTRLIQNKKDAERIITAIKEGKEDPAKYLALMGKTLGCACAPYPCHAEVYVTVLQWLKKNSPIPRAAEMSVER
jgi:hypothetical protein